MMMRGAGTTPASSQFRLGLKKKIVILLTIGVVLCLVGIFLANEYYTKWRNIRALYVGYIHYYVVASTFYYFSGDVSAGEVYSKIRIPASTPSEKGCVFDIGAHNGVWTSNSYYPIRSMGYEGFLFEMDIELCASLYSLYGTYDNVHIFCLALNNQRGVLNFRKFPTGLENTLSFFTNNQYAFIAYTYS